MKTPTGNKQLQLLIHTCSIFAALTVMWFLLPDGMRNWILRLVFTLADYVIMTGKALKTEGKFTVAVVAFFLLMRALQHLSQQLRNTYLLLYEWQSQERANRRPAYPQNEWQQEHRDEIEASLRKEAFVAECLANGFTRAEAWSKGENVYGVTRKSIVKSAE